LLKEAGSRGAQLRNCEPQNVDQPLQNNYGIWVVDHWSKIGLQVTQRVLPDRAWFEAMRSGNFRLFTTEGNCQNVSSIRSPMFGKYLAEFRYRARTTGQFDDPKEVEMYNRQLRELNMTKQKGRLAEFNKYVLDEQVHAIYLLWWQRGAGHRSYVKGWKIGPVLLNQDLGDDLPIHSAREGGGDGERLGLLPGVVAAVLGLAAPAVAEGRPKARRHL